jgi:hypothetical protein
MSEHARLDDRYRDGIWYDSYNGDYCKIQEGFDDDGEPLVELVNPKTNSIYWNMTVEDWETEQSDFWQVADEAVEDPVNFVREMLDAVGRGRSLTQEDRINLSYARQQVSISES